MNLVLFEPDELSRPLPRQDGRAKHLLDVLRRRVGEPFEAGVTDGRRARGRIVASADAALHLHFDLEPPLPPLPPLTLIVGLPRPQTARDVLREATTLGATTLHFVAAGRTDPGYARSSLWSSGEWRRHVLQGAAQACDPRLPAITWTHRLDELLPGAAGGQRLALDPYEATGRLGDRVPPPAEPVTVAIGPERGWDATDRERLRAAQFELVDLGPRVLRVETAVTAALVLITARRPAA